MDIERAKAERMSEIGSSLLRLIQNNGTPTLDLLVRESFQNSLDAGNSADADDSRHVDIDIHTGTFESASLAPEFKDISEKLETKYPDSQNFISIGDKHTCGLTGPVRYDDVKDGQYGNLLKLVYEISKPQESEGSGGSWGLGKTVYYRVGIGLVIFYSRISVNGTYQNRLAATLIEDERKPDKLLPKLENDRGIAWWGITDPQNPERTIPVTDDQKISRILDIFGLPMYEGEDTGTVVIIPYIDEDALLKETYAYNDDDDDEENPSVYKENKIPFWKQKGIADYLTVAAQRWYAPRLNNKSYDAGYFDKNNKSKFLKLFINGKQLKTKDMAQFFILVQKLYNALPGDEMEFNGKKIYSEYIKLRNVFEMENQNSDAGKISYIEVTDADLHMTPPDNDSSPFEYINCESDPNYNFPIMMFTRLPGMIVNYEVSGDWINGLSTTDKNKYIIGLFVPDSAKIIRFNHMSLEEYLRNSEKADHMNWQDLVYSEHGAKRLQIVSKIQKNCVKKIKDRFLESDSETHSEKNIGLGRMLAGLLMPPVGFAGWDSGTGGNSGEGGTGGTTVNTGHSSENDYPVRVSNNVSLKVLGNAEFRGHKAYLHVFLSFGKLHSGIIRVLVTSENGMISPKKWRESIGSDFPVTLNSLIIRKIVRGKNKRETLYEGNQVINENQSFQGFEFRFGNEKNNTELMINTPEKQFYGIDCDICYMIDPEAHVSGRILFEKAENGDDD